MRWKGVDKAPWILKFDTFLLNFSQKRCSHRFKLVKWNFTTVPLLDKSLLATPGKIHYCSPGKNLSDVHDQDSNEEIKDQSGGK